MTIPASSIQRAARDLLAEVAGDIGRLLEESRGGRVGFITREWGFMTPHGLGGPLGGKFLVWEAALAAAKKFFPDPTAFRVFDTDSTATRLPEGTLEPHQHEMLPGNRQLHAFLCVPPHPSQELIPEDMADYRDASRLFILLGSLAHLASNCGSGGQPVPDWIAQPFRAVARRLEVEPALSGHFMVVDNWRWRPESAMHAFGVDDIELLYPAFGHSHERTYHTIPACMAYALRRLPYALHELLCAMSEYANQRLANRPGTVPRQQLLTLMYELAAALGQSKDEFQRISTVPSHRTHVSKHVFIRHMQPFHKGLILGNADGSVHVTKGMSGLHFVSYHLLDAVLGRYHHGRLGELAGMEHVDAYYPRPQRDYSACVTRLSRDTTLRGFLDVVGADADMRHAFNRLIECYAGESGVLAAHSRKLFSYMHNNLQVDTSAEGTGASSRPATPESNHQTALRMFGVMNEAVRERRRLRISPLYAPVTKTVVQVNEEGSFAIVDFEGGDEPIHYQGSDIVRVLLARDKPSAAALSCRHFDGTERVTLAQLASPPDTGWGWPDLWQALGWPETGVAPDLLCDFIEEVHLGGGAQGSPLFEPVSPRVYSVCGTTPRRLRVLISRPMDKRRHFGFSRMSAADAPQAFIACAPGMRFRVPPAGSNLLMVAGGTGISPFVGLAREIGDQPGRYTLIHQTRFSDLFLANLEAWRVFTRTNPGATVMGYVNGQAAHAGGPERFVIAGGEITEHVRLSTEAGAYYFLSAVMLERLHAVTQPRNNFAYCCGGTHSTVSPLRHLLSQHGWEYEFEVQSVGLERTISPRSRHFKTGTKLVDATQVDQVHPGGPQIIEQLMRLAVAPGAAGANDVPDLSTLFFELHPDACTLLRLMSSPSDDEFLAFANLIDREAERGVILDQAAHQYVAAALAFPDKLRVVKLALALESAALYAHLKDRDAATAASVAAASNCLQHLEDLFPHLSADDPDRDKFAADIAGARERLAASAFVFDARTGARGTGAHESGNMEVREQVLGEVLVLALLGRMDASTSDTFLSRWQTAQTHGCGRFVLDLSGLTYISSIGLRALLVAAKRSKLVVCRMSPFVSQIFDLGGMGRIITVKDGLDEAIDAARSFKA